MITLHMRITNSSNFTLREHLEAVGRPNNWCTTCTHKAITGHELQDPDPFNYSSCDTAHIIDTNTTASLIIVKDYNINAVTGSH